MSALVADIANVVERKARRVEREILLLRDREKKHRQDCQRLEQARLTCEMRMRNLSSTDRGLITAQTLNELSQDGSDYGRTLQKLDDRQAALQREQDHTRAQRNKHRDVLLSLHRKAELMRERSAMDARKATRRRLADELAGN